MADPSRTPSVGDGLDGLKRVGLPASAHQRLAQRPGVVGPEGLTPLPDRLARDGDPAFSEQILDVTEAQAKAVESQTA